MARVAGYGRIIAFFSGSWVIVVSALNTFLVTWGVQASELPDDWSYSAYRVMWALVWLIPVALGPGVLLGGRVFVRAALGLGVAVLVVMWALTIFRFGFEAYPFVLTILTLPGLGGLAVAAESHIVVDRGRPDWMRRQG